jgi:signal transduction histidine kinase/predicted RNA-binding protein with RPS1 domain/ActR/RegA family two-component response regulator
MSNKSPRQTVKIRVAKHLPLGLFVELENGQHGIVRFRETSWDAEQVRDWRGRFPVGWRGEATPIAARKGQYREFSLRMAVKDPWENFSEELNKDEVFDGIVAGVVSFGAFIEIDEGITGLLHKSQLAGGENASPLDLFWPGDHVRVRVKAIDKGERQVSLALSPLQSPNIESPTTIQIRPAARLDSDSILGAFTSLDGFKNHILLVEDEPAQSRAVRNWLQRIGQRVDVVDTAEKALEYLDGSEPDLALIDVCLPKMQGNDLARIIFEKWPQVRVVITTDWARADSMMEEIDALQDLGAELLIKPIMPADLIWILRRGAPQDAGSSIELSEVKPVAKVISDAPAFKPQSSTRELLSRCRNYLGFDGVILFALDPNHRAIDIAEQSGGVYYDKTAAASLIFSPVRDVAESKKTVIANEISEDERKFKYLLEFCPELTACLAVPVPANLQAEYALFLIHKQPKQITPEQKIYADGTALALGALLEQEFFDEKSSQIQRTTLIGHLTRSMVHEINNLIGPLSAHVENLTASLAKIETDPSPIVEKEKINRLLKSEINEIQANVRRIINNTRMFGRIVAQRKSEVLRVDEIISETMGLLRDPSDRARVKMLFTPPDELIVIRNQAAALEQVLLNVMLNAIQQIGEFRREAGGWVHIRIETLMNEANQSIFRVFIADNGPGIHTNLWGKIFEAGYTTRSDGSGIGLYLSKNLIEELGGRIYVQESYILGGTTFAIELPNSL